MEIVGLVAPTRHDMFEREPEPHVYLASGHAYVSTMHLHVRAAQGTSPASLVDMVRGEIRAAAPGLPVFSVATLEAHRDRSIPLWFLRTAARLFVILGAAAAFLAVVGLYGVKSYIVSRRTREFGVRQALGATPRDIVRQVLREGLPLTFGGLALGRRSRCAAGKGAVGGLVSGQPVRSGQLHAGRRCPVSRIDGRGWHARTPRRPHRPDGGDAGQSLIPIPNPYPRIRD